jgi:hypothetical protein
MSMRIHGVLTVRGVRPSGFSEKIALRQGRPTLKATRVLIVLAKNLL